MLQERPPTGAGALVLLARKNAPGGRTNVGDHRDIVPPGPDLLAARATESAWRQSRRATKLVPRSLQAVRTLIRCSRHSGGTSSLTRACSDRKRRAHAEQSTCDRRS